MAKLRKMLGSLEDPSIIGLMNLIETQSKETLTNWAVDYAEANFIEIYEKEYVGDDRLRNVIAAVREVLDGIKKLKDIKPLLREAAQIAKETEHPAAQAAARAVAVACAVIQTPTNSLGFTFYGAAAVIYDKVGLEEKPEVYDAMAPEEFKKILESLQKAAVTDEPNPVKIKWNC